MANKFFGKTFLITGGSSGIGLALARQVVASGANVWILARSLENLMKSSQELAKFKISEAQEIKTFSVDVSNFLDVQNSLQGPLKQQTPDFLINSAGVAQPGVFADAGLEVFHRMMEINYFGTVNVIKTVLPGMLQRRSGHIVNISSVAGFVGVYGYSAYGASKFAIRGFSDVLRSELKTLGIRVSIAFPPDTRTPQLEYESQFKPEITRILAEHDQIMEPEDVARFILKGMQKGHYIITPGFETSFNLFVNDLLGNLRYPIMDGMVTDAMRKALKK